jgi:hypothetical protein
LLFAFPFHDPQTRRREEKNSFLLTSPIGFAHVWIFLLSSSSHSLPLVAVNGARRRGAALTVRVCCFLFDFSGEIFPFSLVCQIELSGRADKFGRLLRCIARLAT